MISIVSKVLKIGSSQDGVCCICFESLIAREFVFQNATFSKVLHKSVVFQYEKFPYFRQYFFDKEYLKIRLVIKSMDDR